MSGDHSSSGGGGRNKALLALCGAPGWHKPHFVETAKVWYSTRTKGFFKPNLVQVTEPLITVIVLKQAFKILNSKINFLNISCQVLKSIMVMIE